MTVTTPDHVHRTGHLALTLTLHMDSDWHCGTGLGIPGGVDKLVNTDHDGLPFVPGKTLTGVWRDACELVAAALDGSPQSAPGTATAGGSDGSDGSDGGWHAWVDFLFGSQPVLTPAGRPVRGEPRPAALSVRPARYPATLAAAMRGDDRRRLRDATTFVRPGVKIDPDTGRAADSFLRFEQMARSGVQLTATATLAGWSGADSELDYEGRLAAAAVLLLGARLVESIGGKRRRGAGRCRLDVAGTDLTGTDLTGTDLTGTDLTGTDLTGTDVAGTGVTTGGEAATPLPTPDSLATWLRARHGVAPPVPPVRAQPPTPADPERPDTTGWEVIGLRMHLDTPLVVQERTVGNAVRSLDFVPGSLLLPAVLRRLGDRPGWDPGGLARAGDLVVTNATVEVDGERGRPLPRAWFHSKDDTDAAVNRLVEDPREPGAAAKPYRNTYVGASPAPPASPMTDGSEPFTVGVRKPELTIRTHNVIDDERQRPTSDLVGLYTYEALAAGSTLRAEVRVRAGLLPDGACAALAGTWSLGRSAKDDYGQVTVTVEGPPTRWATTAALPAGPGTEATVTESTITVWLLSDVLIRDARLRPSTDPCEFARHLGAALGVVLTPSAGMSADRLLLRAAATRRTESWQRVWCRPRPTLLGLAAGSVLTFTTSAVPAPDALARVRAAGIGERTAEGFGQIAVDDPLLVIRPGRLDDGKGNDGRRRGTGADTGTGTGPRGPFVPPSETAAYATAQAIEREAWRAHLQREATARTATREGRRKVLGPADTVTSTQLGALRDVLTRLEQQTEIQYWLKRLFAGDRWPRDVHGQVKKLLTDRSEVWKLLGLGPADDGNAADELVLTDGGADRLRADTGLWAEAVRTLVTACLIAHRRAAAQRADAADTTGPAHIGEEVTV